MGMLDNGPGKESGRCHPRCKVPWDTNWKVKRKALWECDNCKRVWYCHRVSRMGFSYWSRVYWFHFNLNQRLRGLDNG